MGQTGFQGYFFLGFFFFVTLRLLLLELLLLCHIAVTIDVAFIVVNIGALLSFGLSLISN